jgi:hypothetical protein
VKTLGLAHAADTDLIGRLATHGERHRRFQQRVAGPRRRANDLR